jgi:hypothetical protein
MTFKSVRHLAGFTIKPLLGVMFVLRALLAAAAAGAIVGGQPDGNGHRYVGFLDASPIGRPDGPTGCADFTDRLADGRPCHAKALPPRA